MSRLNVKRIALVNQFTEAVDIGDHIGCEVILCCHSSDNGLFPFFLQLLSKLVNRISLCIFISGDNVHMRPCNEIKKEVSLNAVVFRTPYPSQNEMGLKTQCVACCGQLPAVV